MQLLMQWRQIACGPAHEGIPQGIAERVVLILKQHRDVLWRGFGALNLLHYREGGMKYRYQSLAEQKTQRMWANAGRTMEAAMFAHRFEHPKTYRANGLSAAVGHHPDL